MSASPYDELVVFESEVDAALEAMPIAALPARTILTYLIGLVFYYLHVNLKAFWKSGDVLTYRISYLLPWLRLRSPGGPDGGSGARIREFQAADPRGGDAKNLISYSHFCEVMPEVHKSRLGVELIEGGFRLVHPTADFALAEATDIIVSELALNHFAHRTKRRLPDKDVVSLAKTAPRLNDALLARILRRRERFYRANVRQAPLVGDNAMVGVFGFDRTRFLEIQAAIFAVGDTFIELATALWAFSTGMGQTPSEETIEWAAPCWTYKGFIEKVADLCGATREEIERFVERFTFDFELPADKMRGGTALPRHFSDWRRRSFFRPT